MARRANFQRENFAHGQIGGAGSGGRDEKDHAPRQCLGLRGQHSGVKKPAGKCEQDAGDHVGRGDHFLAADGVEEMSEEQRAEHIAECERQEITADIVVPGTS